MSLGEFLKDAASTRARERLLHHKAIFDMRLHAAAEGYAVQFTEPEIDNEGFDFTLVADYSSLYIQNKAAIRPGGARSWKVWSKLLKIAPEDRKTVPTLDGESLARYEVGATGAVLIHLVDWIRADQTGELAVTYLYFDVYYAVAIAHGLIESEGFSRDEAHRLLREIRRTSPDDLVRIKASHCLPVKSAAAVPALRLGMGGFHYIRAMPRSLDGSAEASDPDLAADWRRYVERWAS